MDIVYPELFVAFLSLLGYRCHGMENVYFDFLLLPVKTSFCLCLFWFAGRGGGGGGVSLQVAHQKPMSSSMQRRHGAKHREARTLQRCWPRIQRAHAWKIGQNQGNSLRSGQGRTCKTCEQISSESLLHHRNPRVHQCTLLALVQSCVARVVPKHSLHPTRTTFRLSAPNHNSQTTSDLQSWSPKSLEISLGSLRDQVQIADQNRAICDLNLCSNRR